VCSEVSPPYLLCVFGSVSPFCVCSEVFHSFSRDLLYVIVSGCCVSLCVRMAEPRTIPCVRCHPATRSARTKTNVRLILPRHNRDICKAENKLSGFLYKFVQATCKKKLWESLYKLL
jgi:hypothetical protein